MKRAVTGRNITHAFPEIPSVATTPLWQLDIAELAGHNIESRGREEVNRLLAEGWVLLHIYTLKYEENGVWRERPMAILGRPHSTVPQVKQVTSEVSAITGSGPQLAGEKH